ncbi:MAG: hypothetical protein KJO85_05070 [Gammaproteobacteria bacterium]|nr:hypothetical protein [Gammaproteobacteria bacterium]NNE06224.1 hypothetical protein [Xanthomonadales bacterium]
MAMSKRWNILLGLLAAAAFFYSLGFYSGAVAAIVLGGIFEIAFWLKLFRRGHRDRAE